jgi:hypothetical protein
MSISKFLRKMSISKFSRKMSISKFSSSLNFYFLKSKSPKISKILSIKNFSAVILQI